MGLYDEQLGGISIGCLYNAPNIAGLSIVAKVVFSIAKVGVSILLVCVCVLCLARLLCGAI